MKYVVLSHWDGQRYQYYAICRYCSELSEKYPSEKEALKDFRKHICTIKTNIFRPSFIRTKLSKS